MSVPSPLFLSVSVSHSRCFDEKPLKKELLYKCVLYPLALALPFPLLLSPSLSSFLFYCDNSSYLVQSSRWYPYLCTSFANDLSSCTFPRPRSLARSYLRLIYPSFLSRTLPLILVSSVCGNIHVRRASSILGCNARGLLGDSFTAGGVAANE